MWHRPDLRPALPASGSSRGLSRPARFKQPRHWRAARPRRKQHPVRSGGSALKPSHRESHEWYATAGLGCTAWSLSHRTRRPLPFFSSPSMAKELTAMIVGSALICRSTPPSKLLRASGPTLPFFRSRRMQLTHLATRHAIPAHELPSACHASLHRTRHPGAASGPAPRRTGCTRSNSTAGAITSQAPVAAKAR